MELFGLLYIRLLALAGLAHENTLNSIDSGVRCCELAFDGTPEQFSAEVAGFVRLRSEAALIGCQTLHTIFMERHEVPPARPRIAFSEAA